MSDETARQPVEVIRPGEAPHQEGDSDAEAVQHPAKLMRIGSMVRQLLEEVRQAPMDEPSRKRLREVYETSIAELGQVLSPELNEELDRLSLPFDPHHTPSESELRVAHAQLVGWLEGLFHGIQATLFAQQMQMRSQLEEMRRRGLPGPPEPRPEGMPGQYL
jgi:hypothetical protein